MRTFNPKYLAVTAMLLLLSTAGIAADVDGKWNGVFNTPNGDAPVNFNFKSDGAKLEGSTTGPDGTELKITDGKVDGNNVSFTVSFDFGGMPLTMNYKGVVAKDQIKFTIDIFGMPLDLLVKKST